MKINEVVGTPANTAVTDTASEQLKFFAATLARDCEPYFDKTEKVMWRGMGKVSTAFGRYKCPSGRAPVDTSELVHDLAGSWFIENTGIDYRSEAVFASGSLRQAQGYGNIYAVFPIGNFKFCWSPMVQDFTYDLAEELYDLEDEDDVITAERRVYDSLNHARYQTTDLPHAIQSNHEIMIHCGEYWAVGAPHVEAVLAQVWEIYNAKP